MKKAIRLLTIAVLVSAAFLLVNTLMAQPMPGGDPSGGGGGTPVGGYSPVGSGIVMLLALAASYGSRKIYNARKKKILE